MDNLQLPLKHDLKLAYAGSLAVAIFTTVVSIVGILFWGILYPAQQAPNSVGSDAFNLVVILPILLISMWLTRRGSLTGLLFWPGALFYIFYIYTFYVISVPFNTLFLLYIVLVVMSAYTIIGLVASIDGDAVRKRLAGVVPGRAAGGVLIGLAILFIVMDAYAVIAALLSHTPVDIQTQTPWIVDFIVECPALLIGGVLLWRRTALGYVAGAGLLLQIGALMVGVPVSLVLGALLTGSPVDVSSAMLLVIGLIPLALLLSYVRGAALGRSPSPA